MPTSVFNIVNGEFALSLVNTAEVGYLSTWQAPAGKTASTAVIADYTGATDWKCQVINGRLESSPNITQVTRDATFCGPALKTPIAASSSFTLNVDIFQDVHISTGLNKFLYENDTLEAYFLLGLNNGVAPRSIGRARIVAGSFGGAAEEDLKDTLKLECTRKPSIAFGNASATRTGTITNAALTTNVATLTTATTHPLLVGETVTVAGVTPTLFNGTYTITAKTATTFSYAKTNVDVVSAATTGTYSSPGSSIIVGTDYGYAYAPLVGDGFDPGAYSVGSGFDPGAHSVAEVKDYIEAHPDERSVVLAAEAAGRSRASLAAESMDAS